MGEAAPDWDGPLGDAREERLRGHQRAAGSPCGGRSPGPRCCAEFVEVTRTRLAQLGARDRGANGPPSGFSPVGDVPYAVFMEVRVFDSWVHEQDVRRALDRPGGGGNRASAISLDRVQGAMPFVVGKQAGCPDGTAVRLRRVGARETTPATFTIVVEGGRAKPAGDDVAPTVTLSLSSVDFVRLGCGRATAEQVEAAGSGRGVEGTRRSATPVLGAMNFMV